MNASHPELKWLEDPRVFAVNRLDAHSDHVWQTAEGDLRQSLDGAWRFAYSANPAAHRANSIADSFLSGIPSPMLKNATSA